MDSFWNLTMLIVGVKSGRFMHQSRRAGDKAKRRNSPTKSGRVGISGFISCKHLHFKYAQTLPVPPPPVDIVHQNFSHQCTIQYNTNFIVNSPWGLFRDNNKIEIIIIRKKFLKGYR